MFWLRYPGFPLRPNRVYKSRGGTDCSSVHRPIDDMEHQLNVKVLFAMGLDHLIFNHMCGYGGRLRIWKRICCAGGGRCLFCDAVFLPPMQKTRRARQKRRHHIHQCVKMAGLAEKAIKAVGVCGCEVLWKPLVKVELASVGSSKRRKRRRKNNKIKKAAKNKKRIKL